MKGKGPLFAAIVMGVLAALLYWVDLSHAKRAAQEGWELKPVVVAAQDIDEGSTLTSEMVAQNRIPAKFVTASVIPPENFSFIIGQKVMVPVKRGDPLLWTQFESSKGLERLSKAVQKNFRAVTLPATDKDAVGGWLRPNDHVDILLTYRDTLKGDVTTITILQNMLVLATGKITGTTNVNMLSEEERHYQHVTVLMLPEEVELLNLAEDVGKVSMSLRNDEDLEIQPERQKTNLQTLLTGERAKILEKQRAKMGPVIIRGAGGN